jgi:hypothetical protein
MVWLPWESFYPVPCAHGFLHREEVESTGEAKEIGVQCWPIFHKALLYTPSSRYYDYPLPQPHGVEGDKIRISTLAHVALPQTP